VGALTQAGKPEDLQKMLEASPYTDSSTLSHLLLTDSDSATLLQCLLLVAMTLQIPNYIDEIIEILELHIHIFPLLVVLGVFPSLYLKKKEHKKYSSSNPVSQSTPSIASSKTLAAIEEYYRNCAESDSSFVTSSLVKNTNTQAQTTTDDWGHFTDFD
jgi:Na+/glutamate symporter